MLVVLSSGSFCCSLMRCFVLVLLLDVVCVLLVPVLALTAGTLCGFMLLGEAVCLRTV
jgi:hypothetical protein